MKLTKLDTLKLLSHFKNADKRVRALGGIPFYRGTIFYMLLASACVNLFSLALPLTMMQVYDRILPYKAIGTLSWLVIGCLIAITAEAFLRHFRSFLSSLLAFRFEHYLSLGAVEGLMSSKLEEYELEEPGVHLDRLAAIGVLRGFYAGQIFQALMDVPFAMLFLVAIWFLAGPLVFYPIGLIILFFTLVKILKIKFEKARSQQQIYNDRRLNFYFEALSGIHQIKSLTLEEEMLRRFERLQSGLAKENYKVTNLSMSPANLGSFISQLNMFGIIGVGATFVIQGSLTLGGLTACVLLSGRALQPVLSIAGFWIRLSEGNLARAQVAKIASLEKALDTSLPALPKKIRGEVSLRYISFKSRPDDPYLFNGLNLQIEEAEMVTIAGLAPNETTSLLLMMMGVVSPNEGEVWVDDYRISEWNLSNLSGVIEYIPQQGVLFSGTILENITMFDHSKINIAMDTSALLGLDEVVANLPKGYETELKGQSKSQLPTSLTQKICLARALVNRPKILLLDRITSAMDQEGKNLIWALVEKLKGLVTIVAITNDPKMFDLADRQLEIKEGQIKQLKQTNLFL